MVSPNPILSHFSTFPMSSGRTLGAIQFLLKLMLRTNKMYSFSTRSSCKLPSCTSAAAGTRDVQEQTGWRSLGALWRRGEVGWKTSLLFCWRKNSHFPPKKPCLIRKLLVKLEVHLEKVKHESTGRIFENI